MAEIIQNQEFDTKIVLSSRVFDLDGFLSLDVSADSTQFDKVRRVTRTATLDGGAFITDFGYTDSDRTMTFRLNKLDRDTQRAVERFLRTYSEVGISCYDGFYIGALSDTTVSGGVLTLTFLVKERLSSIG